MGNELYYGDGWFIHFHRVQLSYNFCHFRTTPKLATQTPFRSGPNLPKFDPNLHPITYAIPDHISSRTSSRSFYNSSTTRLQIVTTSCSPSCLHTDFFDPNSSQPAHLNHILAICKNFLPLF